MADPRHALGLAAEEAVAAWLRRCGWEVVERRWRAGPGAEIDLLAVDPSGVLVAVEVRARRSNRAGGAAFSLDPQRLERLRRSLAGAAGRAGPHSGLRVDLVTAEPVPGRLGYWRLARVPGIG